MKRYALMAVCVMSLSLGAEAATMLDLGVGAVPTLNLQVSPNSSTITGNGTAWKNASGNDRVYYLEFTASSSFSLQDVVLAYSNGSTGFNYGNQGFTMSLYSLASSPTGSTPLVALGSQLYTETGTTASNFALSASTNLTSGSSLSSAGFLQVGFSTAQSLTAGNSYAIALQWASVGEQLNFYTTSASNSTSEAAYSISTDGGVTFGALTGVGQSLAWYVQAAAVPEPPVEASLAAGALALGVLGYLRARRRAVAA